MTIRADRSIVAALGAVLAGCGGDDTGTAGMTVSTDDGPLAGAIVVFHDSTGQPTTEVTTGDTGRASAEVEAGAMVTVLVVDGDDRYRATFLGVEPDDELTFVLPRRGSQLVGTASVTIEPYPGADTYVLENACAAVYTGDISQPIAIEVRTDCLSPDGTFHLLVIARDEIGQVMARATLRDLDWVDPMNVTMPAWAAMATFAVEASNNPAGGLGVMVQVDYDVNQVHFAGPSVGALLDPGQGASLTLGYVPGFADLFQSQIGVPFGADIDSIDGASMIIERRATPPAQRAIDLGAELLPRLSPPTYDLTDPARPAIAWTAAGSLSGTDGGAVMVGWRELEAPIEAWALLVPPDVTLPVRIPALPQALTSWAPPAGAEYQPGTIWFVDADWASSYDELRNGVGLSFLFGDAQRVFPDGDAAVKVTMSGDL